MPLMVRVVNGALVPLRLSVWSEPAEDWVGIIAWSPLAAVSTLTLKLSAPPDQPNAENDERSRPLTQSSSCLAETIGTPRVWAEATMACESLEAALSVWMFMTNAP